jgi:hypothetical protein
LDAEWRVIAAATRFGTIDSDKSGFRLPHAFPQTIVMVLGRDLRIEKLKSARKNIGTIKNNGDSPLRSCALVVRALGVL